MVKLKMTQSKSFVVNSDPAKRTRLKSAAGFLGLICFSVIIIYFSVTENEEPTEEEDASTRSADNWDFMVESYDGIQCKTVQGCDIDCSQGHTNDLNRILSELSEICAEITRLHLHSCTFPGRKIHKEWLNGDFTIKHLSILDCNVEEIEDEAFKTDVFHETQKLYLNSLPLGSLGQGALQGLYSLIELSVTVESSELEIDSFLKPVQSTLESLKFAFKNRQLPVQDIFGNTIMQSLQIVDLRGNAFGETLSETAFDPLPSVQSLFLSSSQIEAIPEGTFKSLTGTLGLLDLSWNPITYLSPKVFHCLLGKPNFSVQLSHTRLNCDLDLLPFAEVYEEYRSNFRDVVTCFTPLRLRNCEISSELIKNISSTCEAATTTTSTTEYPPNPTSESTGWEPTTEEPGTTTPTPTTVTSSSTASGEERLVNLECDCCNDNRCQVGQFYPTITYRMAESNVEFTLHVVSSTAVKLGGLWNYSKYTILWIGDKKRPRHIKTPDLGCIGPSSRREVVIENLAPNRTYTFCLVKDTEYWISPFDCQSIHIPADVVEMSWLGVTSRELGIAILALGIVFSMLFGCLCAYGVIRCKIYLAGRKRIDLECTFPVKPNRKARKRMGSDDTIPGDSCTSPQVHRKISTISDGSGISYVVPNTYEVIRPHHRYCLSTETVIIDAVPTESPPPLPRRTYTVGQKNRAMKQRSDSFV